MSRRRVGWLVPLALVAAGCSMSGHGAHSGSPQGRPDRAVAGPQGNEPQFLVRCRVSHLAPDDPIIHPGRPGASHLHVFFGNTQVRAESTYEELLGQRSSCEQPLDTASYWVPALLQGDRVVKPTGAIAYYRAGVGMEPSELVPYPPGLMMIAGDATASGPQPTEIVAWTCGAGVQRVAEPPTCPTRAPLRQIITFPDCWDGERIDSENHRDHVRYSSGGSCPSTHPVPIPQLTLAVRYPISGDPAGIQLASGPPYTLHADFWNVWDQAKLTREVEICLHRLAVCDVAS